MGDYLTSVQQTSDHGFILGGYSNSNRGDSKTENAKGGWDYWIVKTDSLGNELWDKTIGGNNDDKLAGIYETAPGNTSPQAHQNQQNRATKPVMCLENLAQQIFGSCALMIPVRLIK